MTVVTTIVFIVHAATSAWQVVPGIEILPGQVANITPATGSAWSTHKDSSGPAGLFPAPLAPSDYFLPGANLGALLVKDGLNRVQAWQSNTQTIPINTPGQLWFVANDTPRRSPGFSDNSGVIAVTVQIVGP